MVQVAMVRTRQSIFWSSSGNTLYPVQLNVIPPSCETYGTDVLDSCNPVTWIDGNTYTSSNNTATHTLINVAGCDSIQAAIQL